MDLESEIKYYYYYYYYTTVSTSPKRAMEQLLSTLWTERIQMQIVLV